MKHLISTKAIRVIFDDGFFIPFDPFMSDAFAFGHEFFSGRSRARLIKKLVGEADALDDHPGRSEGAVSKGAVIRR